LKCSGRSRRRGIAAIPGVGVFHVHFGDPGEIIAKDGHRICATQGEMCRIGGEPDVLCIGELHDSAHFMLTLHRSPDMGMRSEPHPMGDGLPADFIQRIGQHFELVVAGANGRTAAHVCLPMIATTGGKKVAGEAHHLGNEFGVAFLADPWVRQGIWWGMRRGMRRAGLRRRQISHVDQLYAGRIAHLSQRQWLVNKPDNLPSVGLYTLQAKARGVGDYLPEIGGHAQISVEPITP
jgi:hypothetical protein